MLRNALSLCLILAQAAAVDPEIAKGIRTVEEGDYDGAIVVLDQAVRRLAKDPARSRDLSQGYLYLGIAYVGKGHEAAARAKFREALGQAGDLSLSADKFPPKVIDIFEAARSEARQEAAKSGPAPEKKGGGGKAILIGVGVAAVAGVGIAVAGGGGGESSGASTSAPASTPGTGTSATEVYQGLLTTRNAAAVIMLPTTSVAGAWRAELTWTGTRTEVRMFIVDAVTRAGVTEVRLSSATSSLGEWQGQAGRRYEAELFLQEGGAAESSYTLRVTYPR